MKKSQLLKQNEQLFSKLQISNLANKRLMEENESLKQRIEILTHQLSMKESENFAQNDTKYEDFYEEDLDEEFSEEFSDNEPETVFEPKKDIELSSEMEYGAKIIGEIVLQSVNYSNKISELSKPNMKELINLILGKTEVAKANVLDISLSETTLENKFDMMDSELKNTIEYFKSVLGQ